MCKKRTFRDFNQMDWNGFAGAEPWLDENDNQLEPLINEDGQMPDGRAAIIVVDANGISVNVIDDEIGITECWNYDMKFDKNVMLCVAEEIDLAKLEYYGFERIF
jgi:hypothetical protein